MIRTRAFTASGWCAMTPRSPCAFSAVPNVAIVADGPHTLLPEGTLTALWQHQGFTHESAGFHRRYDARGPPSLS